MADEFVALRVFVKLGESNRQALNRTLQEGQIRFPLYLPTREPLCFHADHSWNVPDTNWKVGNDFVVKYEPAS